MYNESCFNSIFGFWVIVAVSTIAFSQKFFFLDFVLFQKFAIVTTRASMALPVRFEYGLFSSDT